MPIGVLIKGDTLHFEVIADSVTKGLMDVGLATGVPVIFGVLTVNTEEQAKDRSEGKNNHGLQWGNAAVEMALLRASAMGRNGKKKFFMGFGDGGEDSAKAPLKGGKVGFDKGVGKGGFDKEAFDDKGPCKGGKDGFGKKGF